MSDRCQSALPLAVYSLKKPARERMLFGFAPFAPRETLVAIRKLANALAAHAARDVR